MADKKYIIAHKDTWTAHNNWLELNGTATLEEMKARAKERSDNKQVIIGVFDESTFYDYLGALPVVVYLFGAEYVPSTESQP